MAPSAQRADSAAETAGRRAGASSSMVAIADAPAISSGYLALSAGEIVKVEYKGCDSTGDTGWSFGCSAATGRQGWFADAFVKHHQTLEHPSILGSHADVSTAVVPVAPGYLGLAVGEIVKVEYAGHESTGDAGWMFGQALATGQKGWFSATAISRFIERAAAMQTTSSQSELGDSIALVETKVPAVVEARKLEPAPEPSPERSAAAPTRRQTPPAPPSGDSVAPVAVVEPCKLEPALESSVAASPTRRQIAPTSPLGSAAAFAAGCGVTLLGTRGLQDLPWKYPLCDKERGCFVGYLPGAVDARKAKKLMDVVQDGMEPIGWEAPITVMNGNKWKVASRQTCWFVAPGCRCTYSYGGPTVGSGNDLVITVKAKDFPPWMKDIMQLVMPLCGFDDPKDWPNCCSMNRYSRDATCDWHSDDDDIFRATQRNTSIISLSLGASRTFELRPAGEMAATCKFDLKGGDLCTMEGMTQKHYQHFLNHLPGPRVNLTWRWIVYHRCGLR